jgi:hypothetical protein
MAATTIDEVLLQLDKIITNSRQANDRTGYFASLYYKVTSRDARDKDINTLGNTLLHFKGMLRFTLWLIHLFEWKDPARIITALHEYKKKFIKVSA